MCASTSAIMWDNSGRGGSASWFLRFVIVQDMQTKQKYYFLCERWLAVEKNDGEIERFLPISTEVQKTQVTRLIKKESKEKFKDSHLWLSIFIRPKQSTFTRLDRTFCAFTILYMSMLMNLMYYDLANTDEEPAPGTALVIGPLKITIQQIGIGFTVNLFVIPPTLLLMTLFTRSKRRITQLESMKRKMNTNKRFLANKYRY